MGSFYFAGTASVASAIAISNSFSTSQVKITIFELRQEPGTIGGAINTTLAALRCLDLLAFLDELTTGRLGCEVSSIQLFSLHTGSILGVNEHNGPEGTGFGGYRGLRVIRAELI